MSMRRREPEQRGMWVATHELPSSPGHVFYEKLNKLLEESEFDRRVEELCEPYYAPEVGRPGIAPGVYFRMLFVGYFEGLAAQRAIAWKCADSLSVRAFLGLGVSEEAPDHSSLTKIRQRLPEEVHAQVFALVLEMAREKGMVKGKKLAVDATTLEANAAMKSMVRRATGEDWKAYLRRLAKAEGMEDPSDEDLRRMDRGRKGKKVSNEEWESPSDPEARITRMKDGRTRFAYKAEHAVDLDSGVIVAPAIYPGDAADVDSILATMDTAGENLREAGSEATIEAAIADKGYHSVSTLAYLEEEFEIRTYIPEREQRGRRRWEKRSESERRAFYANRRRCRGPNGKKLSRRRSEIVERSFAHTCQTGAARRTWLRGSVNVSKRYTVHAAAYNLGLMMRVLFGIGTPRSLQGLASALIHGLVSLLRYVFAPVCRRWFTGRANRANTGADSVNPRCIVSTNQIHHSSTGC